jgi:hypothetical protein
VHEPLILFVRGSCTRALHEQTRPLKGKGFVQKAARTHLPVRAGFAQPVRANDNGEGNLGRKNN